MKKIMICLLASTILLTACSSNNSKDTNKLEDNKSNKVTTQNSVDTSEEKDTEQKDITENSDNTSVENNKSSKGSTTEQNISEKIKNYIINDQENKLEAEKIKWSKTFLNQVDIESLYNDYLTSGGDGEDLDSFANYITSNAPVPSNWEDLFERDLYDIYGEKVVKLEHLQGDSYQAYVKKDGKEVPYVVVSSRTGYFHG